MKSTSDCAALGELAVKRQSDQTAVLETFWKEFAPSSETFDPDKAIALLLLNVRRYEAALLRIAEKPEEQKALMEHREKTGQEIPGSDLQRYFAYLKAAHIAAAALARPALLASLKDLERQQERDRPCRGSGFRFTAVDER